MIKEVFNVIMKAQIYESVLKKNMIWMKEHQTQIMIRNL